MNIKPLEIGSDILRSILSLMVLVGLLSGCGDKYETVQPPGAPKSKPSAITVPIISLDKTTVLFNLATKKESEDKVGVVELLKEGILIHPGEIRPTKVSFKLARNYQQLSIRPFIAPLPADALNIKEAGTVGVEFFMDGKSQGRLDINRDSTLIKVFDFTNVDMFTVVVDNGDGKPWFDWFMLGVVETK